MQKISWVIICILLAGFILLAVICGQCAGTGAGGIDDAQNTINQLRESNKILVDNNRELAASVDRLEKQIAERNRQFEMFVADLTSGTGEATGYIRDALETIRRLEKIHTKIRN